jgi:hypothetical protein
MISPTKAHLAAGSFVLLVAAALAPSVAAQPGARVVKCDGPFRHDASHNDLVKAFGGDNVVEEEIPGAEGEPLKASVIFPKDPKGRLEVIWSDENARRGPILRIRDQSTWAAPNGIRLKQSLAEIEKLNGKPFKISGFGWDYGGQVVNWQKGALDKPQPGGCSIGVSFSHPDNAPERNLSKVQGEGEFLSSNPNVRAVKPFVAELTIANPMR